MNASPELPDLDRRVHELKTDPEVFAAVLAGLKTHEIRFNDRGFQVDDELLLRETASTGAEMKTGAPLVFTGRAIKRTVSHIQTGYGLADGWCILSFARRAQLEGEAPQAGHRAVIEEAAQVFESGAVHNRKAGRTVFAHAQQDRADRLRATLVAPAAQHAESGAPVALDGYIYRNRAEALAAQSQGAQPVPGDAMAAFRKWHQDVGDQDCEYTWLQAWTAASLAAKAEAPAPRTVLSKRIREAATADVTEKQARLLIGVAEEIERAQQAAAPGALAGYKLVPLDITPQMIDAWTGDSGARIADEESGRASFQKGWTRLLAAAPSAPGTPEAPKGGA